MTLSACKSWQLACNPINLGEAMSVDGYLNARDRTDGAKARVEGFRAQLEAAIGRIDLRTFNGGQYPAAGEIKAAMDELTAALSAETVAWAGVPIGHQEKLPPPRK